MAEKIPRSKYPIWVKLSLLGVPGRAGLWFFVWLSIIGAIVCIVFGFRDPRFFAGAFFLFAALMYWLTIRWVDRNGSWDESA
jgi:hypothetical protein